MHLFLIEIFRKYQNAEFDRIQYCFYLFCIHKDYHHWKNYLFDRHS